MDWLKKKNKLLNPDGNTFNPRKWIEFYKSAIDRYISALEKADQQELDDLLKVLPWHETSTNKDELRERSGIIYQKVEIALNMLKGPLIPHLRELAGSLPAVPETLSSSGYALRRELLKMSSKRQFSVGDRLAGLPLWMDDEKASMELLGLPSPYKLIELLGSLADDARKIGLLGLEDTLTELPKILGASFVFVVDGVDPDYIELILKQRFDNLELRLKRLEQDAFLVIKLIRDGASPYLMKSLACSGISLYESEDSKGYSILNPEREDEDILKLISFSEKAAKQEDTPCSSPLEELLLSLIRHTSDEYPSWEEGLEIYFHYLKEELNLARSLICEGVLMIQSGIPGPVLRSYLYTLVPSGKDVPDTMLELPRIWLQEEDNPRKLFRLYEEMVFLFGRIRELLRFLDPEFADDPALFRKLIGNPEQ
jgi:hypothetical protein